MAHLATDKVIVFPVAKERAASVQETRLMTEHNVSNIVRQLMGNSIKGFIISCKTADGIWEIEFNLYGYYFKVLIENAWLNETFGSDISNGIYAYIKLESIIDEIAGQDEDGLYKGLHIVTGDDSELSEPDCILIKLLEYKNNTLNCSTDRFGLVNMFIGGINGKYK